MKLRKYSQSTNERINSLRSLRVSRKVGLLKTFIVKDVEGGNPLAYWIHYMLSRLLPISLGGKVRLLDYPRMYEEGSSPLAHRDQV